LDIDEPTLIGGERAREALALLRMIDTHSDSLQEAIDQSAAVTPPTSEPVDSEITPSPPVGPQATQVNEVPVALAMKTAKRYGISSQTLKGLKLRENSDDSYLIIGLRDSQVSSRLSHRDSPNKMGDNENYLVVAVLPCAFGLMHLLGWNAHFPTPTERTLWCMATIVVTSTAPGVLLVCFSVRLLRTYIQWRSESQKCVNPFILFVSKRTPLTVLALVMALYTFSTLYLFVESIRQLFYLPPKAYILASLFLMYSMQTMFGLQTILVFYFRINCQSEKYQPVFGFVIVRSK